MYNNIRNDKEIIEIYEKVNELENNTDAWAHHDFTHVLNVAHIAEEVLTKLNYPEDIIEDTKVAALLHDTGATLGKKNHAERSYIFAKDYLIRNNIKLKHHEEVLEAIRIHSDGFDTDNIIALALIFADKLDITKDRVAHYGINVEGMRQLIYINGIKIEIEDGKINVYLEADQKIDIKELMDFYFIQKVLKSVQAFSEKLNLGFNVYLNDISLVLK